MPFLQEKEYEKKVADLCARYKDAEIRRLGAYTAVKEVAQRLYKRYACHRLTLRTRCAQALCTLACL